MVDRSVESVVHLEYAVPFDDVCVTPDVPDDRTHEFFGFCRPRHPEDFLPSWVDASDVADAEAADVLPPETAQTDDILETAPAWTGCWFRLDAVGPRPITAAQASLGVDWDTASVEAGNYLVAGYTYEPVWNIWSPHEGVFKVHDGDPSALGPAVAITPQELTPYRDAVVELEGCVDAIAGSHAELYWALATSEPDWQLVTAVDLAGASFSLSFMPPEASWGEAAVLRVDVVDPQDRRGTAYLSRPMLVIDIDTPSDTTGDPDSPGTESDTSGADPPGEDSIGNGGCGCTADHGEPAPRSVGLLLLGLAVRTRTRRSP